uniref:DNA-directed DNA polymerase n=1 Tax=Globodera rostochiensis TaxID=31243 RepID=A0A914GRS9_GLORO
MSPTSLYHYGLLGPRKQIIVFGHREMSQEFEGNKILEFVSGGSKQYSIKLQNVLDGGIWHKTKIRGITFNKKNKLDHEDFKQMILNYKDYNKKKYDYIQDLALLIIFYCLLAAFVIFIVIYCCKQKQIGDSTNTANIKNESIQNKHLFCRDE